MRENAQELVMYQENVSERAEICSAALEKLLHWLRKALRRELETCRRDAESREAVRLTLVL